MSAASAKLAKSPLPEPDGNRIERRKIEFSNRITRAALSLFEKNGVAETSVASIIKEADIAHKTFFNHFPSKEHLLLHIARIFSEHAYPVFGAGFDRESEPRKQLAFVLNNTAKALEATSPHYKELINLYMVGGAADGGEMHRHHRQRFTEVVTGILAEAKKRQQLRAEHSVEVCAEMIVALVVAAILSWSLEADYPVVARMRRALGFINNSMFVDNGNPTA